MVPPVSVTLDAVSVNDPPTVTDVGLTANDPIVGVNEEVEIV